MAAEEANPCCGRGTDGCQAGGLGWLSTTAANFKACTKCLEEDADPDGFKEEPAGNLMARVMAARRKGWTVVHAADFDAREAASHITSPLPLGFLPKETRVRTILL